MPRAIDHLVIAAHDLPEQAALYRRLGFQVGARNRHPWGTENHIVQFDGAFLELIGLGDAFAAPHPEGGGLSLRRLPRRLSRPARGAGDDGHALRRRGGRPARFRGGRDRRVAALRLRPQGAAAGRTRGRGGVFARFRRQPGAARDGFLCLPAAFPGEFLEPRRPGPPERRARRRRGDAGLRRAGQRRPRSSPPSSTRRRRRSTAASPSPPTARRRMPDEGSIRRALWRYAGGGDLDWRRCGSRSPTLPRPTSELAKVAFRFCGESGS